MPCEFPIPDPHDPAPAVPAQPAAAPPAADDPPEASAPWSAPAVPASPSSPHSGGQITDKHSRRRAAALPALAFAVDPAAQQLQAIERLERLRRQGEPRCPTCGGGRVSRKTCTLDAAAAGLGRLPGDTGDSLLLRALAKPIPRRAGLIPTPIGDAVENPGPGPLDLPLSAAEIHASNLAGIASLAGTLTHQSLRILARTGLCLDGPPLQDPQLDIVYLSRIARTLATAGRIINSESSRSADRLKRLDRQELEAVAMNRLGPGIDRALDQLSSSAKRRALKAEARKRRREKQAAARVAPRPAIVPPSDNNSPPPAAPQAVPHAEIEAVVAASPIPASPGGSRRHRWRQRQIAHQPEQSAAASDLGKPSHTDTRVDEENAEENRAGDTAASPAPPALPALPATIDAEPRPEPYVFPVHEPRPAASASIPGRPSPARQLAEAATHKREEAMYMARRDLELIRTRAAQRHRTDLQRENDIAMFQQYERVLKRVSETLDAWEVEAAARIFAADASLDHLRDSRGFHWLRDRDTAVRHAAGCGCRELRQAESFNLLDYCEPT